MSNEIETQCPSVAHGVRCFLHVNHQGPHRSEYDPRPAPVSNEEIEQELAVLRARLSRLEETVEANAALGVPGILRGLEPGESTIIECDSNNHAASIRGSAYRILGKGNATTRRISHRLIEVKRL